MPVIPLHLLPKLLAAEDHAQKRPGTTFKGGEESVQYYISQTCDEQRFEARKVGFSSECLNFSATVYSSVGNCFASNTAHKPKTFPLRFSFLMSEFDTCSKIVYT